MTSARSSLLGLAVLLAASSAHAAPPSFDCAKAESNAEKMVCSDEQLAALDRETARLYGLALIDPHADAARIKELKAFQRGWVKGRDECWKADDKRACVRDSYAIRIFELRQGFAHARSQDANGMSRGPLALECDGFGAGIGIAFIKSKPSVAVLAWKDRKIAIEDVPTGSGEKYAGASFDGEFTLSTKADDAIFDMPDKPGLKCRIAPGG